MKDDKIIKIPITYKQKQINKHGEGYVPCEVSDRWLQFSQEYSRCAGGDLIPVSVMTLDKNQEPKKICDLIINKDDIIRAINSAVPEIKG